ncbi:MAG: hypothetical protein DRP87_17080, partial [Spirochaetes bacterium]
LYITMKNIQISIEDELLKTVDRLAAISKRTRSAIVREAVKNWVRQKEIKAFEEEWIKRLKKIPQEVEDSDAWMKAEQWDDG